MGGDVLLVVVVAVSLGFDFTNGFHDTANAVATSVSTRALSARTAVFVAAVANLAGAIDDICDHVDEAADNMSVYGVTKVPKRAWEQATVIHRAATQLDQGVRRLDGFRDSRDQLNELRRLEDEGDRLNREAVSDLFKTEADAMTVIRWKDIHERLEEAVDACENAADVLEAILVKNR